MWDAERYPDISYLVGLDLAQSGSPGADYTALSVIQRTEPITGAPPEYVCIHLDRWRDRRTARIPETVHKIWRQLENTVRDRHLERTGTIIGADPTFRLVVDQTGVGPFGLDPLRAAGFDPIGIVIHGGDTVSHPDWHTYRVPKRDLAGAINTLLQSDRLRFPTMLRAADDSENLSTVLKAELENFRVKININTGHDSYGAGTGEEWRVGAHDDLVLSVAVAVWLGELHPTPRLDPAIVAAWTDLPR